MLHSRNFARSRAPIAYIAINITNVKPALCRHRRRHQRSETLNYALRVLTLRNFGIDVCVTSSPMSLHPNDHKSLVRYVKDLSLR